MRYNTPKFLIISFLFVLIQAAKAQTVSEIAIYLKYTPRSETVISISADALNKPIAIEPIVDAREGQDKSIIGENTESSYIKVRTRNSVDDFVNAAFKSCYTKWGGINSSDAKWAGTTSPDAKMHLKGEISKFFVSETNLYRSDIRIKFTLTNENGLVVWQRNVQGSAKVFGRSLKQENYNEAFSDALQDAFEMALTDIELWAAWDKKVVATKETFKIDALKDKVLSLKKEGLEDQLIVAFVSQRPLENAMTAEQVIDWKNAGIPQSVISALMRATGDSK